MIPHLSARVSVSLMFGRVRPGFGIYRAIFGCLLFQTKFSDGLLRFGQFGICLDSGLAYNGRNAGDHWGAIRLGRKVTTDIRVSARLPSLPPIVKDVYDMRNSVSEGSLCTR